MRLAIEITLAVVFCFALFFLLWHKGNNLKQKLLSVYTFKNYALLFPYAKPYIGRALLAVLITIPVGSMDAVIAWSLKPFMDVVLVEKQTSWTMYIPLLIIIFSVLQALFTYVSNYMNTWVGNKISLKIKEELFDKLQHSDASFFDNSSSGDVILRYNKDADSACGGLLDNMRMFLTRFFSSLSLIFVLFYNSWQLAIVAVAVLFGALLPMTRMRKRLKKVITKDVNAFAKVIESYNNAFNGNRVINAYNLHEYCKKNFVSSVNTMFDLSLQMFKKTGIMAPLMHIVSAIGIALVIWYGSYLIINKQITAGNFASFITSLVMLYNPLKSIANNYNSVIFSLMAIERVFSIFAGEPKIKDTPQSKKLKNCKGDIVFADVNFEYIPHKPVLKHINLNISHGQTIALVGNSGGGKTTISSLLPRFYDVTSGKISIDGINIKDIKLHDLRENIAFVFQDNFLFSGTIRENITFSNPKINEKTLQKALKNACLDEFINSLDNGLDTQIGERGILLSGGQKQRLAIARAFIKNAPILVLDEATSALDNKSEAVVQKAIDNLMKDRTVLVIAHRLSTVRNADKIVVINNGEIVEEGNHEELLKLGKEYAALYKTQLV